MDPVAESLSSSSFDADPADVDRPADAIDLRQSRNLDCAPRRDWKDVVRWVSSSSSCFFSCVSCG